MGCCAEQALAVTAAQTLQHFKVYVKQGLPKQLTYDASTVRQLNPCAQMKTTRLDKAEPNLSQFPEVLVGNVARAAEISELMD